MLTLAAFALLASMVRTAIEGDWISSVCLGLAGFPLAWYQYSTHGSLPGGSAGFWGFSDDGDGGDCGGCGGCGG